MRLMGIFDWLLAVYDFLLTGSVDPYSPGSVDPYSPHEAKKTKEEQEARIKAGDVTSQSVFPSGER